MQNPDTSNAPAEVTHTDPDTPLTDPAAIARYIAEGVGLNAPPLSSWHYCGCKIVTKVAPKKSNKVMREEAAAREEKIRYLRAEAEKMGIAEDNPDLVAKIAEMSVVPPRKESPKVLDTPCDYKTKNRNAMRVHLRTQHEVHYCEYCRARWDAPQKQKWVEHRAKFPSGQCRY